MRTWNDFESRSRRPMRRLVLVALILAVGPGCKSSRTSSSGSSSRTSPAKPSPSRAAAARPTRRAGSRLEFVGGYYERPRLTVRKAKDGTVVMVTLKRVAGRTPPGGKVFFTHEPYTVSGTIPTQGVQEANLLGTGLRIDLDGDGAFTSTVPVRCEADGSARVGDTAFGALFRPSSQHLPDLDYTPGPHGAPVKRLGEKGAHLVVYRCGARGAVTLGLTPPGRPMPLARVASPALQLFLAERIAKPGQSMSATLDSVRVNARPVKAPVYQSRQYGGVLARDAWEAARYMIFGVDAKAEALVVTLTVRGVKPGTPTALLLMLNTSHGARGRRRHLVGLVPLQR